MPKTVNNIKTWEVEEKVSYEEWLSEVLTFWPMASLEDGTHQILAFLEEDNSVIASKSAEYGSWLILAKNA